MEQTAGDLLGQADDVYDVYGCGGQWDGPQSHLYYGIHLDLVRSAWALLWMAHDIDRRSPATVAIGKEWDEFIADRKCECGSLHRHVEIQVSPSLLLSRENVLKYIVPEIERLLKR